MSTIPVWPTPQPIASETVEDRFQRLATIWLSETAHVSSSSDLVAHPAFLEIVGMGPAVIPLLLGELEKNTGHWHRALRQITGIDPVSSTDRGNIAKARAAWLHWGKEQGFSW